MGQEKFSALARGSYERGIRFFDAADLYGTHPFLAVALQDMPRKDFVISTKIWWRPGGLPEKERYPADVVIERFLKELKTDYLDLAQLHCAVSAKWPTELSDHMNILAKLKKKGIIRAHGLSVHSVDAMKAAVNESWVDSLHARINPYGVKMDVEKAEDVPKVAEVLKALRKKGKAVIGMKILGEGTFRDSDEKRDASIKYALESGCVDAMVVGFEKVSEVDDFAERVRKVKSYAKAASA